MDNCTSVDRLGGTGLVLSLALALSALGCGSSDKADELFAQGPFEVGYRELAITYPAPASLEDRELTLRMWYPAKADSGASPALYAVAGIVDLPTEFALDAPPAIEDNGLPLVIYSHGNGGEGLLAYPFGELMASHGWVLVAPNHTGNSALDFLSGNADPFPIAALNRPADITAIIDAFETGLSGDELAGKADTSRVFVFGHSFGGYTSFAAGGADIDFDGLAEGCEGMTNEVCDALADPDVEAAFRAGFGDSRVVAIAPQAPALAFADGELGGLGIPTMLMTGRLDQTTTQQESAEPAWAGVADPDDLWVEMPDGAHFTFVTICHDLEPAVIDLFQPDAGDDGCGPQFIPTTEAIPVLAAYVLGFGRLHVLGETEWDPILTGPALGEGFEITLE